MILKFETRMSIAAYETFFQNNIFLHFAINNSCALNMHVFFAWILTAFLSTPWFQFTNKTDFFILWLNIDNFLVSKAVILKRNVIIKSTGKVYIFLMVLYLVKNTSLYWTKIAWYFLGNISSLIKAFLANKILVL